MGYGFLYTAFPDGIHLAKDFLFILTIPLVSLIRLSISSSIESIRFKIARRGVLPGNLMLVGIRLNSSAIAIIFFKTDITFSKYEQKQRLEYSMLDERFKRSII